MSTYRQCLRDAGRHFRCRVLRLAAPALNMTASPFAGIGRRKEVEGHGRYAVIDELLTPWGHIRDATGARIIFDDIAWRTIFAHRLRAPRTPHAARRMPMRPTWARRRTMP